MIENREKKMAANTNKTISKTDIFKTIALVLAVWFIGFIFICLSIKDMFGWTIFHPNRVDVEATVLETDSSYHYSKYGGSGNVKNVYVSYELNGKQYNRVLLKNHIKNKNALTEGSTITISLDPLFPRKILSRPGLKVFMYLPLCFTCFVIGIVIIIASIPKKRKNI